MDDDLLTGQQAWQAFAWFLIAIAVFIVAGLIFKAVYT